MKVINWILRLFGYKIINIAKTKEEELRQKAEEIRRSFPDDISQPLRQ
jgi:hypothetical protein